MARVLVLGSDGMLGHVLVEHLRIAGHDVVGWNRESFDVFKHDPVSIGSDWDYVINCIAITKQRERWGRFVKQRTGDGDVLTIGGGMDIAESCFPRHKVDTSYQATMINAAFPWRLASTCKWYGIKFIHISSPAVFEPTTQGLYVESDCKIDGHTSWDDMYATTKAWGEPNDCMTLRLSIVGHEKSNSKKLSLLEWFKGEATKKETTQVWGFTNHWWNGMTTKQVARCVHLIIENNWYTEGPRHIFSPRPITKLDTLCAIRDHLKLDIKIEPLEHEKTVVETLETQYGLNAQLNIPDFIEQVRLDL